MTTAYIVSQPLAGAARSGAVYRLLGTCWRAAAAVGHGAQPGQRARAAVPGHGPGGGRRLTVSLLDRTPRSYILMLAGYTAAIIGFPAVNQPGGVFEIAVSRVIEIGLGILCATLVHSLVFPRPVGTVLRQRLAAWLGEADRWALDVLKGQGRRAGPRPPPLGRRRQRDPPAGRPPAVRHPRGCARSPARCGPSTTACCC